MVSALLACSLHAQQQDLRTTLFPDSFSSAGTDQVPQSQATCVCRRQQAEGGPSAANEPPAPKAPEAPSTGSSYLDKIQGSLSIQMQPGASGGAPEPEPEAPRSLFGGDKKGPMAFPSSPPEEKAAAVEESKPAFSFFSKFGGGGGGDSKPSEPESKPSSPFPAVDEPKGESKPAFSFGAAKKEEAPALPSFAAPFAAPPAPAPEAPSKPWWERTEELGGGTPVRACSCSLCATCTPARRSLAWIVHAAL